MITPRTIDQSAGFGQIVPDIFVVVVPVVGVRALPNSFAAAKSAICLVPAADAAGEDEFEEHAVVEGHEVVF
jgi:hypothetical protein